MVAALVVILCLDYGNATLYGINARNSTVNNIMNSGIKLIFEAKMTDQVTSLLKELHWLKANERQTVANSVMAFLCAKGLDQHVFLPEELHFISNDIS